MSNLITSKRMSGNDVEDGRELRKKAHKKTSFRERIKKGRERLLIDSQKSELKR